MRGSKKAGKRVKKLNPNERSTGDNNLKYDAVFHPVKKHKNILKLTTTSLILTSAIKQLPDSIQKKGRCMSGGYNCIKKPNNAGNYVK